MKTKTLLTIIALVLFSLPNKSCKDDREDKQGPSVILNLSTEAYEAIK